MKTLMLISVILLAGCAATPTVKSVAGTYEGKPTIVIAAVKLVFLENGKVEIYKHPPQHNPLKSGICAQNWTTGVKPPMPRPPCQTPTGNHEKSS